MDINITLTVHSPILDKILALIEDEVARQAGRRTPAPAARTNNTAAAPAPAQAEIAKKRKKAEPKPEPEPEPEAEAEAPVTQPARRPPTPELMKAAAAMQPTGPSEVDLIKMVGETMDVVGVPAVRDVLKRFKVASIKALPPEKYADFATALQEMRDMVGTSGEASES